MSIDIGAIGAAQGVLRTPPVTVTGTPVAGDVSGADDAVEVDMIPATPPPEVLDAIATAADAYQQLAASGRNLHFTVDRPTGRVTVLVQGRSGDRLGTISGPQVLDAAAGLGLGDGAERLR